MNPEAMKWLGAAKYLSDYGFMWVVHDHPDKVVMVATAHAKAIKALMEREGR